MGQHKKIEVFSNVIRTEKVEVINSKIVPGSLVFESKNPFPGYYHETPGAPNMAYLYIALDKHHSLEKILRSTQRIEGGFEGKFDAGKGFLNLIDEHFYVLRLRHFENYDLVEKIQEAYASLGIGLLMNTKKQGIYDAKVRIVKFLSLYDAGEGVFIDTKEDFFGYIEIPKFLGWQEFFNVTMQVRYNWEGSEFDAAYGSFYHEGKLREMVRVYSQKLNEKYLADLRSLYLEKIKL
jgi:hypothetical protein